jgi:hypothetical protein
MDPVQVGVLYITESCLAQHIFHELLGFSFSM